MRKQKLEETKQLILNTSFWEHRVHGEPREPGACLHTAEWPSALIVNIPLQRLIIRSHGEEERRGGYRRNRKGIIAREDGKRYRSDAASSGPDSTARFAQALII